MYHVNICLTPLDRPLINGRGATDVFNVTLLAKRGLAEYFPYKKTGDIWDPHQ